MAEIPPSARPRLKPYARLQWDAVRGKHVLLAPETVLMLNETASAVLTLCDGRHELSNIAAELGTLYQREVEQDVRVFLDRLANKKLIDFHE